MRLHLLPLAIHFFYSFVTRIYKLLPMKLITYFFIFILLLHTKYSAQPVDIYSNLVLCLPMNGNGNDYSGNTFNGTLSGPTPTVNRFGVANSALHFNGTSDFISIPTNTAFTAIETSNELTITGWCSINNWYQAYNVFQIFEKYDAVSDFGWGLGLQNPNTNNVNSGMHFLANANTQSTYQFIGPTVVPFNQWDFYCVTWSKSTQLFKAYRNGALINTVSTGGIQLMPTASVAYVGFSPAGPDEYSDGNMDELRVYNRALTDQDIMALYALQRECDGLSPVGAEELAANPVQLLAYPNPCDGRITVTANQGSEFCIYNSLGQTVHTGELGMGNHFHVSIDLSPGIYYLGATGLTRCMKLVVR